MREGLSGSLQSIRSIRSERLRHRNRSNRLEVIVPFRVLTGRDVVGCMGYPRPDMTLAFAECVVLSVFQFLPLSEDATPRTFLSWGSTLLHGLYPKSPSWHSRSRTTLMGFDFPSTHQAVRVHVRPVSPVWPSNPARRPNQRPLAGPNPPATAPLAGFLNLSATSSSQCRPAIFRQVAFMGFALQGVIPSTKPPTIRHR